MSFLRPSWRISSGPHFTEEKRETQRGEATYLGSQHEGGIETDPLLRYQAKHLPTPAGRAGLVKTPLAGTWREGQGVSLQPAPRPAVAPTTDHTAGL